MCGRESPPITTLDAGPADREIEVVWGANMATDRHAFELAGMFDAGVPYGFDEDMWERRLRERGGRVMYVARAGLVHRRDAAGLAPAAADARRLPARPGLRAYIEHRGEAPRAAARAAVLAGCVVHIFRRRCGNGLLLTAHSAGRVRGDAGAMSGEVIDPERVLSGESGIVEGPRRRAAGTLRDLADDAAAWCGSTRCGWRPPPGGQRPAGCTWSGCTRGGRGQHGGVRREVAPQPARPDHRPGRA